MSDGRFTKATARAAGAKGSRAATAKRLTPERVQEALGPLETVEDAQRRLECICTWLASGLLSGSAGGAASRAVEIWLKAHSDALDRDRLKAAEKRVRQLERELASVRGRGLGIA